MSSFSAGSFSAGSFYQALAPHYDALFGSDDGTVAFLVRRGASPGARVLDAACGTGSFTRDLLARGADAYGTDLSESMIGVARTLPHADRFTVVDMLDVDRHPASPFDLVFCIGNSIAHLPSLEEVARFFAAAGSALRPSGSLVVQYVEFESVAPGDRSILPALTGPGVTLERTYTRVDADSISFDAVLRVGARGAATEERLSQRLLALSAKAVGEELRRSGFVEVTEYGGFDEQPVRADGWVRVLCARLPD